MKPGKVAFGLGPPVPRAARSRCWASLADSQPLEVRCGRVPMRRLFVSSARTCRQRPAWFTPARRLDVLQQWRGRALRARRAVDNAAR